MSSVAWRRIPCKASQVRLDVVLSAGQSFRWHETSEREWRSVLRGKVWTLKQDAEFLYYTVHDPVPAVTSSIKPCSSEQSSLQGERTSSDDNQNWNDYEAILTDYFQLNIDLQDLYDKWSAADINFSKVSKSFTGIRTLRQEPVENLFSFICSSNNNISRITSMIEKMCSKYGEKVASVDGIDYFSFPTVSSLADPKVEQDLRSMGFGYRAKFINKSAQLIIEYGGQDWLLSLRKQSYQDAHSALCKLPGIGSKVADCVCLMSLDKHSAIPVDTHVWQITAKCYMPNLLKNKTLTDKLYLQIGDHYRCLFGEYAGWAHSVSF
ncbi:predicted protein [Nematostella vectensis]|uniref:N-glycosylase/DNA lyase n=1 Tax=Nematostella vectensis TaxID=45351 RepID=A7SGZ3_NEMVE|nr:predicted protein [Nematostella vectensis]|eukprot:XP_001629065.1 predicted protein [Nematostella vectensis]